MVVSTSVAAQPENVNPFYCTDRSRWHQYGDNARQLHLSRVLSAPALVTLTGSTQNYQQWVCEQPCVVTQSTGTNPENRNRFVNIRCCISQHNPGYHGIAMCEPVHELYQCEGILSTLISYGAVSADAQEPEECARAWLQDCVFQLLHHWVWETLKGKLGYQHWYDVPPEFFQQWLRQRGIGDILPKRYLHVSQH